eukprot:m.253563 g.253563  ORF g.253563 m.253563 type:complete len:146 (+) comp17216_c0_seq1:111-548(+)
MHRAIMCLNNQRYVSFADLLGLSLALGLGLGLLYWLTDGLALNLSLALELHDLLLADTLNSTSELLSLACAALGGNSCDTLLVLASVEDGPGNLAGVLALVEEGLDLGSEEEEGLAVGLDENSTVAGVDLVSREAAQLKLHGACR